MEQCNSLVHGYILHMRSLRDEPNGSTACNDADPCPTLRTRVHRISLPTPLDTQAGTKVQTRLSDPNLAKPQILAKYTLSSDANCAEARSKSSRSVFDHAFRPDYTACLRVCMGAFRCGQNFAVSVCAYFLVARSAYRHVPASTTTDSPQL